MRAHASLIGFFYIKSFSLKGKEHLPKNAPALIASTHPNSFLDSVVLQIKQPIPVWSLARGDAFKKKMVAEFLDTVKMIPIFRLSEGKENLSKNNFTFDKCKELFRKNQYVIIFSEGICKNPKELLPLKKGTARLALEAWEEGINVPVVPMGITYDTFKKWGKVINLHIGSPILQSDIDTTQSHAIQVKEFNDKLAPAIEKNLLYDFKPTGFLKNPLYYLGWVINFPLYFFIQWIVGKKFGRTIFYDSIAYFALYFLLPFYWLILGLIIYSI
ncbi:Acyltransferase [Spirosomataceae bacterium TFI 002]|nr:Acyltransferase [Spirosomataceae bacterium TFI 002]